MIELRKKRLKIELIFSIILFFAEDGTVGAGQIMGIGGMLLGLFIIYA